MNAEKAKRGLSVWFAQYVDDVTCGLLCYKSNSVSNTIDAILKETDKSRIIIYVKEGCGYCKRGKQFLFDNANGNDIIVKNGESMNYRFALKKILKVPSISFPIIIIDKVFHGGSDDVNENSKNIIDIIKNKNPLPLTSEEIAWSPYIQEKSKFNFFTPPGGKNKSSMLFCCQTKVFSNVIRLWSLFHVVFFSIILLLSNLNASPSIIVFFIWFMTIDILMFEIHGSNPFSILSTLSTIIVWQRRGNAVTSVPYKVVFFIYLTALVKILYEIHFISIGSLNSNANKISILSAIVNSSMLALTRF